jgi:ABC-type dipeptide/oligopeptide/nickel transport system permease component
VTTYLARRLFLSVFVLWGAITIVFLAVRVVPGDPALMILGSDASADQIATLRERMGLDRSLGAQYVDFLARATRLDFGASIRLESPAMGEVARRLPVTGQLALAALVVALSLSFPLGILAALYYRSLADNVVSVVSLLGQAMPNFWLGIMMILIFARWLRLLPSAGSDTWAHMVMPTLTLALPLVGVLTRLIRSGLLEVLAEDYIRTAHAKGLRRGVVIARHALPNMLIPVITVVGLQLGYLLGGAVIVETVFAWPGVGQLLIAAISNRDYPIVQASITVVTGVFIAINLLVDLSYGYLDPRIRLS